LRSGSRPRARFTQWRSRRGEQKAIGAIRHDILIADYRIVSEQTPFRELGSDWLGRRHSPEHRARRPIRQLEALGFNVSVEAAAWPEPSSKRVPLLGPPARPLARSPTRRRKPRRFTPRHHRISGHPREIRRRRA